MLQEMRIETANFDASVGHGTGLGISMMTKAGTNRYNGSAAYQFWSSKLNGANYYQQRVLDANPALQEVFDSGKSTNLSFTMGGPVVIPKLVNGQNKLFFFANYSYVADLIPGNIQGGATTIPARRICGAIFPTCCCCPTHSIPDLRPAHGASRSEPAGPRDPGPVPEQHHSAEPDRQPDVSAYAQFLPKPNQNPTSPGLAPNGQLPRRR